MPRPLSLDSTIVAATDQISSDLAGEEIILNLKSGVYFGLDRVGTQIWKWIQKPCTIGEIKKSMLENFDVDADRAEQDLIALIDKLDKAGLVEIKNVTAV